MSSLSPHLPVYTAPCLTGQCRLLHIYRRIICTYQALLRTKVTTYPHHPYSEITKLLPLAMYAMWHKLCQRKQYSNERMIFPYAIAYRNRGVWLANGIEHLPSHGPGNQHRMTPLQHTALRLDDLDHADTRQAKVKQHLPICFSNLFQKYLLNYLKLIS